MGTESRVCRGPVWWASSGRRDGEARLGAQVGSLTPGTLWPFLCGLYVAERAALCPRPPRLPCGAVGGPTTATGAAFASPLGLSARRLRAWCCRPGRGLMFPGPSPASCGPVQTLGHAEPLSVLLGRSSSEPTAVLCYGVPGCDLLQAYRVGSVHRSGGVPTPEVHSCVKHLII